MWYWLSVGLHSSSTGFEPRVSTSTRHLYAYESYRSVWIHYPVDLPSTGVLHTENSITFQLSGIYTTSYVLVHLEYYLLLEGRYDKYSEYLAYEENYIIREMLNSGGPDGNWNYGTGTW